MAEEEGYRVTLNVYDLSKGLARQLSGSFLGMAIEAIWHTGVVVYGNEYFFGGGIQHMPAGTTQYGTPIRVVDLGVTHIPKELFEEYLQEIAPRYTAEKYSLLTHNCNNFSHEVAQFLVDKGIPDYILQLPNEVMRSPMGALIMPMIQNIEATMRSGAVPQVPQFKPPQAAASVPLSKDSSSKNINGPDNKDKAERQPTKSTETKASASPAPPAVKPATVQETKDPLGDARSKVQEEITREFAALMATGAWHASEAATQATKRVMQKYGHLETSTS